VIRFENLTKRGSLRLLNSFLVFNIIPNQNYFQLLYLYKKRLIVILSYEIINRGNGTVFARTSLDVTINCMPTLYSN